MHKTKKTIVISIGFLLICSALYIAVDVYLRFKTKEIFANKQGVTLATLINGSKTQVKGEDLGRTNIMIYGVNQSLADVIILASYYWNEKKLVLLSIPRDLFAVRNGMAGVKINSLFSLGQQINKKDKSSAPQYISDFISKEYNIPIDYWVVAKMNSFKKLVNALGGITVEVERTFTDYQYPTDTYSGYIRPAVHFEAGIQTMDGTAALIFARSRHSLNSGEGSDFARSRRQQILIKAMIDKFKQKGILEEATIMNSYLTIFQENVFTNITSNEAISLASTINNLDLSKDILMTNWKPESGFLCATRSADGQYIITYGVRNDCRVKTAASNISSYKQKAIDYIHNLLIIVSEDLRNV